MSLVAYYKFISWTRHKRREEISVLGSLLEAQFVDETQATEEISVLGSLLEVQFVEETQATEEISVLGSLL